jgi:hypothetical protein
MSTEPLPPFLPEHSPHQAANPNSAKSTWRTLVLWLAIVVVSLL